MIKIKPIIFSACGAFVFSFLTALFSRSGLPVALLKAVIFAAVFGGLAVGIQFVYGAFLSDGVSSAEPQEETKTVGSRVDLVVSEEDLPDDKDGPAFFVDGKHILSGDDISSSAPSFGLQGAVSAKEQNQALDAAEKVREQKAAQNIAAAAQERVMEAAQKDAAQESAQGVAPAEKPAFAPIDLAAKNASADEAQNAAAVAFPAASSGSISAEQKPKGQGDSELDELPDISGLGGASSAAAEEDDDVIEDSEFAQEGSVKAHRQTEFSDGKVADVKDAPVFAEAIRTVLKREE